MCPVQVPGPVGLSPAGYTRTQKKTPDRGEMLAESALGKAYEKAGERGITPEAVIANIPSYRMTLAMSVPGLTLSERAVLTVIAGSPPDTGFECWHSQQDIAEELGIDPRNVRRAYTTLQDRGLISYQIGEAERRYKSKNPPQPKGKDKRSKLVYLRLDQLILQANTEPGRVWYENYQQKKRGPQTIGQKGQTREAQTSQQEEKPQLKIVQAPPVDDGESDKPPVVVPAQKPLREMTPEERKEGKAFAVAELRQKREATTGAEWVPPL